MQTINSSNYRKVALQIKRKHSLTHRQYSMYESCLLWSLNLNSKEGVASANTPSKVLILKDLEMKGLIDLYRKNVKMYTANLK